MQGRSYCRLYSGCAPALFSLPLHPSPLLLLFFQISSCLRTPLFLSQAEEANNAFLLSGNGCVFPFIYGGKTYFDCAIRGSIFRCCALNVDYIGRWKYCTRKDHAKRTFPFIYRGKIYESCTKTGSIFWRRWCSLSLNFDQDRAWRYC
uniref:Fibronectin type-II domain-containing protein n=1 Tax=Balaenoptera musculus TaxID=9771 RepID=A0A8C0I4Z9_BALMU